MMALWGMLPQFSYTKMIPWWMAISISATGMTSL